MNGGIPVLHGARAKLECKDRIHPTELMGMNIGIVGLGLIGGSLALDLRQQHTIFGAVVALTLVSSDRPPHRQPRQYRLS
ncbi:MAG: hypothetical protein HC878_19730 [Leptolyngbyaceae cyanobacterium SL_5_14]|nr:hypothetical protein [Leptolyngbyaceae cyanobacterium SL_5_14]